MFEFRLPDVGEGVAEGELVAWHVDPGETVAADQVLAEVETDKAVVDLPSPVAGTVAELHAEPGEVVPVGEVLVTIDPADDADGNVASDAAEEAGATGTDEPAAGETDSEAPGDGPTPAIRRRDADDGTDAADSGETDSPTEAQQATPTAPGGRVFAPPQARRLAREHGIDIRSVAGSGPGGRVTAADVRDAAGASGAADQDVAAAITEVAPETDVGDAETAGTRTGEVAASAPSASEPRSAIRRVGDRSADEGRPAPATAADRDRTLAAPATRRLADDLDVDLDAVPTEKTRDGDAFVEPEDVRDYAEAQQAAQAADAALAESAQAGQRERETREPYRGVRRTIGEQMERAATRVPHAAHHDRAVVDALVDAREAMQPRAEERGVRLTYLPFVLKAVVAGLREHPVVNTSLDEAEEEIVYKHYYDVGVATATDAGLMVPVVRDVDEKGILQLASEVNELTEKARERSITREEMQGGTFTVTNFGAIGGEYATPIVNYPETAILGLGSIEQRPVVVDGEVEASHTLPLSLSIDHRVIDGAEAAGFVNTVIEYLETPSLLLLD